MTTTQIKTRIAELTKIIRETNDLNAMMNAQLSINGLQKLLKG